MTSPTQSNNLIFDQKLVKFNDSSSSSQNNVNHNKYSPKENEFIKNKRKLDHSSALSRDISKRRKINNITSQENFLKECMNILKKPGYIKVEIREKFIQILDQILLTIRNTEKIIPELSRKKINFETDNILYIQDIKDKTSNQTKIDKINKIKNLLKNISNPITLNQKQSIFQLIKNFINTNKGKKYLIENNLNLSTESIDNSKLFNSNFEYELKNNSLLLTRDRELLIILLKNIQIIKEHEKKLNKIDNSKFKIITIKKWINHIYNTPKNPIEYLDYNYEIYNYIKEFCNNYINDLDSYDTMIMNLKKEKKELFNKWKIDNQNQLSDLAVEEFWDKMLSFFNIYDSRIKFKRPKSQCVFIEHKELLLERLIKIKPEKLTLDFDSSSEIINELKKIFSESQNGLNEDMLNEEEMNISSYFNHLETYINYLYENWIEEQENDSENI